MADDIIVSKQQIRQLIQDEGLTPQDLFSKEALDAIRLEGEAIGFADAQWQQTLQQAKERGEWPPKLQGTPRDASPAPKEGGDEKPDDNLDPAKNPWIPVGEPAPADEKHDQGGGDDEKADADYTNPKVNPWVKLD
jgi:hypothetical protein